MKIVLNIGEIKLTWEGEKDFLLKSLFPSHDSSKVTNVDIYNKLRENINLNQFFMYAGVHEQDSLESIEG